MLLTSVTIILIANEHGQVFSCSWVMKLYEYLEGDRGFIEEAVKLWVEKNMPGEGDAFYSVPIPDKTHLDSLTTANIKALE